MEETKNKPKLMKPLPLRNTVAWSAGLGYSNNFIKSPAFSSLKQHISKRLGNLIVSSCPNFQLLELSLPPRYLGIPNSVYSKDSNKHVMVAIKQEECCFYLFSAVLQGKYFVITLIFKWIPQPYAPCLNHIKIFLPSLLVEQEQNN